MSAGEQAAQGDGPAPEPPRLDLSPTAEYVADLAAGTLQEWFHGYVPVEERAAGTIGQYRVHEMAEPPLGPTTGGSARLFVGRFRFEPVDGPYRRPGRIARVSVLVELEE